MAIAQLAKRATHYARTLPFLRLRNGGNGETASKRKE
jgi:hypothetical protein